MAFTDAQPWLRLPGEPVRAYHAFTHYIGGTATGSIDAAWRQHVVTCDQKSLESVSNQRRPTTWARWSSRFDWIGRRDVYLADLERQRREKFLKAQHDAIERHARTCQAAVTVATVPVRAVLDRLTDPKFRVEMQSATALTLLRESWRAGTILPGLIAAERQALGLSVTEIVVEDRREQERSWADRIAANPRLVDLATEMLDEMVRMDAGEPAPAAPDGEPPPS